MALVASFGSVAFMSVSCGPGKGHAASGKSSELVSSLNYSELRITNEGSKGPEKCDGQSGSSNLKLHLDTVDRKLAYTSCADNGMHLTQAFTLQLKQKENIKKAIGKVALKRFSRPMSQGCLIDSQATPASRLAFKNNAGMEELFVAEDTVSESSDCANPEMIDGTFSRSEFEKVLKGLKKVL